MPTTYEFKDSKASDVVARALLFVAKFSKKQALVRFSDTSISIIWGGSPKTYFIQSEVGSMDMFKNRQKLRQSGLSNQFTVIQVNPSILGRTLKVGSQDRNVTIYIIRPSRMKIQVDFGDVNNKRTIFHTLPCEMKTYDDYRSMLIGEIEQSLCRFNTKSYVDNIHRFKHIVDSFVKLNTARIYIWSKQSSQGNDLTIQARTSGSNVCVSLSDLEDGYANMDEDDGYHPRRDDAGVSIDTKRLASFLSGLNAQKRSKVSFDIEHNKCLKITLENESTQGEKFYQSLLLLHSLIN